MRMERALKMVVAVGVLEAVVAGLAHAADGGNGGVAIPLPGSLALLVTGVVGLAGASWWLRRK